MRTTIAISADLLARVDEAVRRGEARGRNELIVAALRRDLAAREHAAIDVDFAGMAGDAEYRREARTVAKEFEYADWEAFQLAEGVCG